MRHLNTRREQLRDALLCAEEALKKRDTVLSFDLTMYL